MPKNRERDLLHLLHMREAAQNAIDFVERRERADLDGDKVFQLAVVKAVELVGESAYQLSDQFKEQHSEIPWLDIIDMRHILVHNYWRVEMDTVWDTANGDIPKLVQRLNKLIELENERRAK